MAPSRIVELSSIISENTAKVDSYLTEQNLPFPSFDPSSEFTPALPRDIKVFQDAVLEATDELNALLLGPVRFVAHLPHNPHISLQAIQRFEIAKAFPIDATTTYPELARAVGVPEPDLVRLLRHSMTYRIFQEPTKGVIAHTAASKALAQVDMLPETVGFVTQEMWPAAARVVDAIQKWPGSGEPNEAGYSLAYNTNQAMMDVAGKDAKRSQQMSKAMSFLHSGFSYSAEHVIKNFDWGEASHGVFVDIGGSLGPMSTQLARWFPNIRCIVQDQPEVIAGATIPQDLKSSGRLQYMAHNFFEEQPVVGADVYFFQYILHDWSDQYAVKILRNLIPALKKGSRVLVSELCLPPPGAVSAYKARPARMLDLAMKEIQNGKERDADDWEQVFKATDSRFHFQGVQQPPQSTLALISAVWEG